MLKSKHGIIGLAIGDAMGVPIEFCSREILKKSPVTEMIGYGSHQVPKGTWSDDTSMVLATIDSLTENKSINTADMADRFLRWFKNAEYTPYNDVFDVGRTTLYALARYEEKLDIAEKCGGTGELDNGNGSLMRMLPIAYWCYAKESIESDTLYEVKRVSSITHRHEINIMGCYMYVIFAISLLQGMSLKDAYDRIKILDYSSFSVDCIGRYDRILNNDIFHYELNEIKSTGFVVDTLEATLWVMFNSNNYNDAIIKAINLGEDTDTVGACVGGLAGIKYEIDSINENWKKDLIKYDYIEKFCEKFDEILKM